MHTTLVVGVRARSMHIMHTLLARNIHTTTLARVEVTAQIQTVSYLLCKH